MALFKKLIICFLILVFLVPLGTVRAVDDSCSSLSSEAKVECYKKKINEKQDEKKTLSSQIDSINDKIALTKSQIEVTQNRIDSLDSQIASKSSDIAVVEKSLSERANIFANRIVKGYILSRNDPINYLLVSNNFAEFWQRFEYLTMVQKSEREEMIRQASARKVYSDIKEGLENTKKKKEILLVQQRAQKTLLDQQNAEKQALLNVTRNDETRYQQLLAEAQAQLAAFGGFVNGLGGGTLISADPSWPGDYFSQRDTRWGNVIIAGFNFYGEPPTINKYGCLVTSVAMVVKHKGNSVTPLSIGTNSSYFDGAAMFRWDGLRSLGLNTPQRTLDRSVINSALDQGKWVIVGMEYSPRFGQPFHFVVITEKKGDDYNLFDPYRGPNVSFNSNYGGTYITEVITY